MVQSTNRQTFKAPLGRSEAVAKLRAHEAELRRLERGVEIISEASRHLADEMKARHPEIPWAKVAGIGNVLRHEYERIAPDVLWRLSRDELLPLEKVCREELAVQTAREENAGS
jgi:uncharacterized protein with HEPN domain